MFGILADINNLNIQSLNVGWQLSGTEHVLCRATVTVASCLVHYMCWLKVHVVQHNMQQHTVDTIMF